MGFSAISAWPLPWSQVRLLARYGPHPLTGDPVLLYENERALPRAYLAYRTERAASPDALPELLGAEFDPRRVTVYEGEAAPLGGPESIEPVHAVKARSPVPGKPGDIYALDEALADALSGKWTFVGTGEWFGGPGGWPLVRNAMAVGFAAALLIESIVIRYGWLREWFPAIPQLVITAVNPGTVLTACYAAYSLALVRRPIRGADCLWSSVVYRFGAIRHNSPFDSSVTT